MDLWSIRDVRAHMAEADYTENSFLPHTEHASLRISFYSSIGSGAEIRKQSAVPVLFLTAKSQDSDKSMGFSVGGDNHLVKPFSYSELVSRVKAMLRRYYVYGAKAPEQSGILHCCGNIDIDPDQCLVHQNGQEVSLTGTEYRILYLMASHPKKVFTVQNIYESVWEEPYFYSSNNTVMVHIRNLRRKLGDDPQNSHIIQTVWGKGYRIGQKNL